jgi:protein SCO1/2
MVPQHPIVPVFISIDPRRDTPARMKAYKKDYMPQMLWLTGTDEEVSKVAKAYRVYYSAPDVDEGADDDYLVDHSIFFYLLDREGHFVEFFGKSKSAEEVAQRMAQLVVTDNK